jgi:hypothetical protein
MQPPIDKRMKNPAKYIVELADAILPLRKYGFAESFISSNNDIVVFTSDKCKIKFIWGGWDYLAGYTLNVYYGRLIAENEKYKMVIDGKEYRCWHLVAPILHFLDNSNPGEVANRIQLHWIKEKFIQSDIAKSFSGKKQQPEWLLHMHNMIWESYGSRIEELFDMYNTASWNEYKKFLTKVYDISGRTPEFIPPEDQIC